MSKLKGKRVLITGGACGIGRKMAGLFANSGCEVIISDINQESLDKAAAELQDEAPAIYSYRVDVSSREQVEEMATHVLENVGRVDILINNAGIPHTGEIVETSVDTWEKLMGVNFWGPLYHTYAFLPSMIEAESGHIVNVSSGQAFFRLPTWGPYSTTKLALGGFSELKGVELEKFNIKVTTVYPFMINTGFYDDVEGETWGTKLSMKLLPYYSMSPEKVAKIIFKAVKKQKPVEMVSVINNFGTFSRAVSPLANVISKTSLLFLGKKPEELKEDFERF